MYVYRPYNITVHALHKCSEEQLNNCQCDIFARDWVLIVDISHTYMAYIALS